MAAAEGGLYIAGARFSFEQAADRALAENRAGQKFFVLALPPAAAALTAAASAPQAALRQRLTATNGVVMVCRRDLDSGRIDAAALVGDVVAVRGWPAQGEGGLGPDQRYFAQEDAAELPTVNESLRSLRATCS